MMCVRAVQLKITYSPLSFEKLKFKADKRGILDSNNSLCQFIEIFIKLCPVVAQDYKLN